MARKQVEEKPAERVRLRKVKREDCRKYLQDEVADVLPEVMDKAKSKVLAGDLAAFKRLWDMSGLARQVVVKKKRGRGLGVALLKRLKGGPVERTPESSGGGLARSALGRFVGKKTE